MTIKYLWLTCMLLCCASLMAMHPPTADDGDFARAQHAAQVAQHPLLVYVYVEDLPEVKKMDRLTWKDATLRTYVGSHYTACSIIADAKMPPEVPSYKISTYPTLLIYHPDGRLMGSVEGFVAPKTLLNILDRHVHRMQPQLPDFLPLRQKTSPTLQLAATSQTAKAVAPTNLQVKGLEAYSLGPLATQQAPVLGIHMGSYHSLRHLQQGLKRLEKRWPGKTWVYANPTEGQRPTYHIVIGAFDDAETAKRYMSAVDRMATTRPAVMNLTALIYAE